MKNKILMKMKNKNLLIILLLTSILMISGCSLSTNSGENQNGFSIGTGSSSSFGGNSDTQGVLIKFDKNNPPSEMIKGSPATFVLLINNYQNHPITDLDIKTKGFDTGFISGLWDEKEITNVPKKTVSGPGMVQEVIQGVTGDGFTNNYNFNPKFEYAYTAYTQYLEQICVPNKMNKCNVKIDKSTSQNGPVTIKINRMTSIDNNIRIDFTAQNSGSGKVVNEENKFKTDDYAVNYNLEEVKLGSQVGNCKHIGVDNYQFMNGKSSFYCEFNRASDDSYASQISVKLKYTYNQEIGKNIIIKDLNAGY